MMEHHEVLRHIVDWFFSDTIELLDKVLDDNDADPQYSAITTMNRLWLFLQHQKETDPVSADKDVFALLQRSGYTDDDISALKRKIRAEQKIYRSEILWATDP